MIIWSMITHHNHLGWLQHDALASTT